MAHLARPPPTSISSRCGSLELLSQGLSRQEGVLCHQPELAMGSPFSLPCPMHMSPGCTAFCIASQGKGFLSAQGSQPAVRDATLVSLPRGDAASPLSATAIIL